MRSDIVKNETDLKTVKDYIIDLDTLIVKLESELIKQTQLDKIEEFESIINKLRNRRLGYYLATKVFEATNKNQIEQLSIEVEEGDTLTDISIAFFGVPDYWEQIYFENNLSSATLSAGQKIIIPEIKNDTSYVLLNKEIYVADLSRYILENV
jgi:nucleoid-associated protein YgaU